MKKSILRFCCLLIILASHNALGAIKNITITWTIPNNNNVLGYKMYYSYDSIMANKMLACETTDSSATSLTCTNINLEHSPVYAIIAAILPDSEMASTVKSQTIPSQFPPVQGFKIKSTSVPPPPPETEYKLTWSLGGDNINTPSNKEANRIGNGKYISTGCYEGNCYDNRDANSYLTIPVINNDIIDPNNFIISLYFNPKSLADYRYIFSIAADNNNTHNVHVYQNGDIFSRTILNGTEYYGYLDTPPITTGTWYKLTYSFSSNQIKISINDTLVKDIATSDTFIGEIPEIRLAGSSTGYGSLLNCLLDNVTIK